MNITDFYQSARDPKVPYTFARCLNHEHLTMTTAATATATTTTDRSIDDHGRRNLKVLTDKMGNLFSLRTEKKKRAGDPD
ncbi:hypothetical protein BLOT_010481 [Blomia tropicalis]|nr:hypothetical protein BLOT_010481 [Blomia tropicalis]